ncbi:CsgG/HfaB family protein [Gemmatimonadota bacterium]
MISTSRRYSSFSSTYLGTLLLTGLLALVGTFSSPSSAAAGIATQQQEPITVGVIDLEVNNVDEGEARAVSERLRTWLGRTGVFQVIERNQMDDIMEELGFQYSGACNTDECVVQVGQMLGATKMIAGSISLVGTLYSLQVRIVDMTTSRIEHTSFRDEEDGMNAVLREATQFVANELAAFVRGTATEPASGPGEPATPLTAQITLQNGVAGSIVRITGDDNQREKLTGASHNLTLPPGTYTVTVRLPGYTSWQQEIQLNTGDQLPLPLLHRRKSRLAAGLFSLVVPGAGHYYSGRNGRGTLALLSGAAAVVYGVSRFETYVSLRNEYDGLRGDYAAATLYEDLADIKTRMDDSFAELQSVRDNLDGVVALLGLVWVLNAADAIFLMPRHPSVQEINGAGAGAALKPDLVLEPYHGRLSLNLRVSFQP